MTDPKSNTPYIALARKYRSSHFGELIGQKTLVTTLSNAIENDRVHHAYMFTGIRGTGKTSTARIIAKALNYVGADGKGQPTTGPTDDCAVCQAITQDRHPDVIELDAASHTGVDDMRELIDGVRYAPVSARYKIYIIDEVHMLSKQAFNALLKTLEEPPENTVFMFATTEVRKVPVTILSRCQRFDLRRIDLPVLAQHYKKICDLEGVTIDDEAIHLIARAADGSVRDGLSLLDQAMSQSTDKKISADMVSTMLGQADRAMIIQLFEAMIGGNASTSLEILGSLHKAGAEPKIILDDLLNFTHLLTRIKMVPSLLSSDNLTSVEKDKGKEFSGLLSIPVLTRIWQMLLKGVVELQTAPQPMKALEMIIIRVIYSADHPPLHKLVSGTTTMPSTVPAQVEATPLSTPSVAVPSQKSEAALTPTPTKPIEPPPQPVPTQATQAQRKPEPQPEIQPEKVSEEGQAQSGDLNSLEDVVALCYEKGEVMLGSEVYARVRLVNIQPGRLEFNPMPGTSKDLAQRLRKYLSQWTGEQWFISISGKEGQPTLSEKKALSDKQEMDTVLNHPLMKKMADNLPPFEIISITDLKKED